MDNLAALAESADSLLRTPGRGLLGVGTLAAVFVLARCMRSVQRGLAAIADAPARSVRREWVRAVLLAAVVLIVGSVLLAGFTLGPLLGHSRQVGGAHSHEHGIDAVFAFPLQVGAARLGVLAVFADQRPSLLAPVLSLALTFVEVATSAAATPTTTTSNDRTKPVPVVLPNGSAA